MRMRNRAGARALGVGLAALVAACGGGSASHASTAPTATVNTSATTRIASATSTTTSSRSTTSTRSSRTATTASASTTTSATPSTTTHTTTTAPPSTTTTTVTTASTQTTRTQSGPAFVQTTTSGAGGTSRALTAAIAVLARHGYVPVSTDTYGPADTLHVLVGVARAGGPAAQHAFFFNEGTYLGTDASTPSARITVLSHGDSDVTLAYTVVHAGTSSVRHVRFALDMGQLAALDPLPSAAARR